MNMELIINSSPLDFELTELLGEKPSDFLVMCFDGQPFERFGTPFDTPGAREDRQAMADRLNDRSKDSWWPEMWVNWSRELKQQYNLPELDGAPDDQRPTASVKVSRVCHGYSSYLQCAVRLFEHVRVVPLIARWGLGNGADGRACVEIESVSGNFYGEIGEGEGLSIVIGRAVKRLLLAEGMPNSVLNK